MQLTAIYSSVYVSPCNTVFIDAVDSCCSYLITRHCRDGNGNWQLLVVCDTEPELLLMASPCMEGSVAALLVVVNEVQDCIRFWTADDDFPEISIQEANREDMSTQSLSVSRGGEMLLQVLGFGVGHSMFSRAYSVIQLYTRQWNDSKYLYACVHVLQDPQVTCLLVRPAKITYDAHFSPCGRFILMVSGRHRFGYNETTIASIDLMNVARGKHTAVSRVLHEQHSEATPCGARGTCIRYMCWTSAGMLLALGRGAVYLRQHTHIDNLQQALIASGA